MTSVNLRKYLRPVLLTVVAVLAILVIRHIWNYYNLSMDEGGVAW